MREIKIDVRNEYVLGDGGVIGAAGSGLDVVLAVSFGDEWDDYEKEIEWRDARGLNPKVQELDDGMIGADGRYRVPVPYEAKAYAGRASCVFRGEKSAEEDASETVTATGGNPAVDDRYETWTLSGDVDFYRYDSAVRNGTEAVEITDSSTAERTVTVLAEDLPEAEELTVYGKATAHITITTGAAVFRVLGTEG